MTVFSVTILGAGSASPMLGRYPTAQLLTYDNEHYLIDCGEGTQYRLLEQKARIGKLNTIFISHLHGDHYFGLIPLLSSLNLGGRTEDLWLFGPKGLDEILTLSFKHSQTPLQYTIRFTAVDTTVHQQIFENEQLTVHSIPLNHRVPCSGYLFAEKPQKNKIIKELLPEGLSFEQIKQLKDGQDVVDNDGQTHYASQFTLPAPPSRSYAFCSDTCYDERIAIYVSGVDMLYHEATFQDDLDKQAAERYHATARQAAQIAQQSAVGRLLIGHFSSRYKDLSGFLEQAQEVFAATQIAEQGSTFWIE
jgi:ribonuclease Z